ncbi:MAG: hypothetical protein CSA95_01315 [Bacteroidetes bacterium]|nr:MAG: hypothetical protein CSA95_01315 [Bacteroidota bacterium]
MVLLTAVQNNSFNSAVVVTSIIILLLLIMSGLVSGSEVAYFSLTPQHLDLLRRKEDKRAQMALRHLDSRSNLLASILVANNFVNVAIILLFTFISKELLFMPDNPLLQFVYEVVIVSAVLLLFGEILPKIIATKYPIQFAEVMAKPLKIIHSIFYPIIYLLVHSTRILDKKVKKKGFDISRDELTDAINITIDSSQPEEEKKMLRGIAKFGDTEVSEIMKSRMDVVAVECKTNFEQLMEVVKSSSFSRIPVYKENFDQIQGILYIKDLLPHLSESSFSWTSLLRETFFVPENKKINELLREFQEKKIHMAIVVDEYGGTSGIVTMEDILEEIVGDISDESDTIADEVEYEKLDERNYLFNGKTSLNDLCKIIDADDRIFDEVKGEAETLAGLILELHEEIPSINESISWDKFTFLIKEVNKRRIIKIHLQIHDHASKT